MACRGDMSYVRSPSWRWMPVLGVALRRHQRCLPAVPTHPPLYWRTRCCCLPRCCADTCPAAPPAGLPLPVHRDHQERQGVRHVCARTHTGGCREHVHILTCLCRVSLLSTDPLAAAAVRTCAWCCGQHVVLWCCGAVDCTHLQPFMRTPSSAVKCSSPPHTVQ